MNIVFPKSKIFFSDLILQRTDGLIKCGGREALNRWMKGKKKIELIDFLLANNKYEKFMKITMDKYLEEIDEFLDIFNTKKVNNIISIGPGNGVFELILLKKIKFNKILLIDIENTKHQYHGFNKKGSGYSCLKDTKFFFISNNIPSNSIIICNPTINNLPKFEYDLAFSLFSMGFHYPCNQYVNYLIENAKKDSKIILDKRKCSIDEGYKILLKNFKLIKKIPKIKHYRVLLCKK